MKKNRVKQYAKAGMGIYTLIVLTLIISGTIIFYQGMYADNSDTRNNAQNALDFISVLFLWVVVPYFCVWMIVGCFFFIKWFIVEPLKEKPGRCG